MRPFSIETRLDPTSQKVETVENVSDSRASDDFSDFGGRVSVDELLIARNELVQRIEEGDLHLRERAEPDGHGLQFLATTQREPALSHFLRFELVHLRDNRGEAHFDVVQQQLVQLLAQKSRPVHPRNRRIPRSQELFFVPPLLRHAFPRVNILLPAVNHSHVPQAQRNHAI